MSRFAKAILKVSLAAVALALAVPAVARETRIAELLHPLLPEIRSEELDQLLTSGELVNMYGSPDRPRLAPVFLSEVRQDINRLDPGLGVEVLVLLDQPNGGQPSTLQTYETLHAISTMAGIEYYSASRGYMRTLFHESYVIDDPDERNRVPDPQFDSVPPVDTVHVFQRDSSFGKNVYELRYRTEGDAILLSMTNLTRMLYRGIVPALGPERLRMHIAVVPVGDKVLLYGSSGADSINALGMEERARNSFYNRIVALHSWYLDQVASRTVTDF